MDRNWRSLLAGLEYVQKHRSTPGGVERGRDRPAWLDESPERYGPILNGDFVVITGIDDRAHFIRVTLPGMTPDSRTACGVKMPDWVSEPDPRRFFFGGVVDCVQCLEMSRAALGGS